jgi:HEPN domain-containing protein
MGAKGEVDLMRKRARAFLEAAEFSIQRGNYDLAAFNAEQASQLYLKSVLLEFVGDYPRTHSAIALLKELERIDPTVGEFLAKEKRGLHNLEDSYLMSRYFYKLFDREDGDYLVSLAKEVMTLCERIRERMGKGEVAEGLG